MELRYSSNGDLSRGFSGSNWALLAAGLAGNTPYTQHTHTPDFVRTGDEALALDRLLPLAHSSGVCGPLCRNDFALRERKIPNVRRRSCGHHGEDYN